MIRKVTKVMQKNVNLKDGETLISRFYNNSSEGIPYKAVMTKISLTESIISCSRCRKPLIKETLLENGTVQGNSSDISDSIRCEKCHLLYCSDCFDKSYENNKRLCIHCDSKSIGVWSGIDYRCEQKHLT